jgi:tetratricopeptide (TPR) repeat protein
MLQSKEGDNIRKMQEIYFYAKKYFDEGKYDKSIKEFEVILELSPSHQESLRMIDICNRQIALTETLLDNALDEYKNGELKKALSKLEEARKKDRKNFQLRSLIVKVLTELGMEYSFVELHHEALEFLERAKQLSPEDKKIQDMINISNSMIKNGLANESEESQDNTDELKKMSAVFEEYQKQQNEILKDYIKTQARLQEILESSENEKAKIYKLLEEREELLDEVLKEGKNILSLGKKTIWIAAGLALVLMLFTGIILKKRIIKNREIAQIEKDFQDKIIQSIKVSDGKQELSEYEKKLKKLDILDSEMTDMNSLEDEVAVNIVSQYLNDVDYRIRLRAVNILHKVEPKKAVQILCKIINSETGEIRASACNLLGEIDSDYSVELLLRLADSKHDDIKKNALAAMVKILHSNKSGSEIKKIISNKLDEINKGEDWIIA